MTEAYLPKVLLARCPLQRRTYEMVETDLDGALLVLIGIYLQDRHRGEITETPFKFWTGSA